jgi:hypothetical protein
VSEPTRILFLIPFADVTPCSISVPSAQNACFGDFFGKQDDKMADKIGFECQNGIFVYEK